MRAHSGVIVLGLTAIAASVGVPESIAGEADPVEQAFVQRCASCHTVPDPQIRTDLAWLDQVNRTA